MRGNRTKKTTSTAPKPIKIRSEKKDPTEKTLKRRAIQYLRKHQEEKYKRLNSPATPQQTSNYAEEFKSDFDDSLAFLQKLTDQSSQKISNSATLKQYPVVPNSALFQSPVLDNILSSNIEPELNLLPLHIPLPPLTQPTYGCLKGGKLPTYRTLKSQSAMQQSSQHLQQNSLTHLRPTPEGGMGALNEKRCKYLGEQNAGSNAVSARLTPEQQRAELKQFLEKRKDEKLRVEQVKRQRHLLNPSKKQKRTTIRTFRVGKSKMYPRVGVLIPNKTIRTQILDKKQKIRETPIEDIRKYLIKKGLVRVGTSCPNDVLRKMYETSMMMCGEIQNHNPDNLLFNYLHNGL
jgi:hypothetical protein